MRKLIALTAAAWLVALAPCAALALCATPQTQSCCTGVGACCCRAGNGHSPAPAPSAPTSRVAPDQLACLDAEVGAAIASDTAMPDGLSVALASMQGSAPVFLTGCSFRC